MKIPELFQEIIHNDKTRKELIKQEIVPIREYISLKDRRKELHRVADRLYGYRLGDEDNTRRS